jgi:hypothetical protein
VKRCIRCDKIKDDNQYITSNCKNKEKYKGICRDCRNSLYEIERYHNFTDEEKKRRKEQGKQWRMNNQTRLKEHQKKRDEKRKNDPIEKIKRNNWRKERNARKSSDAAIKRIAFLVTHWDEIKQDKINKLNIIKSNKRAQKKRWREKYKKIYPEKVAAQARSTTQKYRDKMADGYIIDNLVRNNNIPKAGINMEIVKIARIRMTLVRIIRAQKEALNG